MNGEKRAKTSWRMHSVDIMRGISIFLMMLAHMNWEWLQNDSMWLIGFKFIILNYAGTSQFVFISGLGFTYSWCKSKDVIQDEKTRMRKSMSKTIVMIALAFFFNFMAIFFRPKVGFDGLWYWNILQTIAISRLLATAIIDYSPKIKFVFYFGCVLVNSFVLWWMEPRLETSVSASIVYYALFHPMSGDIFIVNFGFFVMGTVVGEELYKIKKEMNKRIEKGQNTEKKNDWIQTRTKWFLLLGLLLVSLGIVSGMYITTMDHRGLIQEINTHPKWNISGMYAFFSIHSHAWAFCCSGIHITLTSLYFYFIDYKSVSKRFWNMFYYYGRYSLTIYFSHYLIIHGPFVFYPNFCLTHKTIWPAIFFTYTIMYLFVYEIDKQTKGKASFEFIIGFVAKKLFKFLEKRANLPRKNDGTASLNSTL